MENKQKPNYSTPNDLTLALRKNYETSYDLKTRYFKQFIEVLEYTQKEKVPNTTWYPEFWIADGISSSINATEMFQKFLDNSSLQQKQQLLETHFIHDSKKDSEFSFQLSLNIDQNTLLKFLDDIATNLINKGKAFESMCVIFDFADKYYDNAFAYKEKIKLELVKNINDHRFDHGVFQDNMDIGNKFEITSKDMDFSYHVRKINLYTEAINEGGISSGDILDMQEHMSKIYSAMEHVVKFGFWDEEIKNINDNTFSRKNSENGKLNEIGSIFDAIKNPSFKEKFKSFIEQRALDLNTSDTNSLNSHNPSFKEKIQSFIGKQALDENSPNSRKHFKR